MGESSVDGSIDSVRVQRQVVEAEADERADAAYRLGHPDRVSRALLPLTSVRWYHPTSHTSHTQCQASHTQYGTTPHTHSHLTAQATNNCCAPPLHMHYIVHSLALLLANWLAAYLTSAAVALW